MYNAGQGRYRVVYSYIVGSIEEEVNLYPGYTRSIFILHCAATCGNQRGERNTAGKCHQYREEFLSFSSSHLIEIEVKLR